MAKLSRRTVTPELDVSGAIITECVGIVDRNPVK